MNTFIQQGHIQLNLEYYKIFKFQIIPVLFNFLFIKESQKNITVIIFFSWTLNQHIRIISEGSGHKTKVWVMNAKNSAFRKRNKVHFKRY